MNSSLIKTAALIGCAFLIVSCSKEPSGTYVGSGVDHTHPFNVSIEFRSQGHALQRFKSENDEGTLDVTYTVSKDILEIHYPAGHVEEFKMDGNSLTRINRPGPPFRLEKINK